MNAIERADRKIRIATLQGSRDIVDANPAASQGRWIDLHAHGIFLFARDQHLCYAANRRKPLRQRSIRIFVYLR